MGSPGGKKGRDSISNKSDSINEKKTEVTKTQHISYLGKWTGGKGDRHKGAFESKRKG